MPLTVGGGVREVDDAAALLTIPHALDFHDRVGPAAKEARLRYLRSLWTEAASDMPHIEVLGGSDEASWSGIASFRLAGRDSLEDATALQLRLEKQFGIFAVVRKGLASGCCVRITPQVFNTPTHMSRLLSALDGLKAAG